MPIPAAGKINNLVSDLKNRKQESFTTLYEDYSGALYGAIGRIITNEADAQDTLQNTFIKVWRSFESYDAEKGTLFTWMLNIAQHEAIDFVRSKYHKRSLVTGSLYDIQKADRQNPFIHLDTMDLYKLLAVLKPMDRAIFELIYFRGYSCEQSAKLLAVPCGTIKTKLQRGYRKLRTVLSQPGTSAVQR